MQNKSGSWARERWCHYFMLKCALNNFIEIVWDSFYFVVLCFRLKKYLLKELVISFQAYFRAHEFINRHRLWKWILIPGVIYAIIFFTGMWFFWGSSGDFLEWLFETVGVKQWLDRMQNDFLNFLFITGTLIFRLILLFFYFSLFKYKIGRTHVWTPVTL